MSGSSSSTTPLESCTEPDTVARIRLVGEDHVRADALHRCAPPSGRGGRRRRCGRRDRCSIFGVPELNAIGIAVADLRRSMQFYRLLGLDLPEDPAEDHVEATMANGTRLMFDPEEVVRSFLPDWARANGNQVGLAFECETAAEVDEVYARIVAAGFEGEKEPWDAFWGQRYALLGDPDGVRVNLYAALT